MRRASIRSVCAAVGLTVVLGALGLAGPIATAAAAPPQILSVAVESGSVTATGATLRGSINPKGSTTRYRFEYITEAAYEGNVAASREPFFGAAIATSATELVGSGTTPVTVFQSLKELVPETAYLFRLRAINAAAEPSETPEQSNTPSRPATFRAASILAFGTSARN